MDYFVTNKTLGLLQGTLDSVLLHKMLRSFHIENFKSLTDFTIEDMGQFLCLIGLNGAGKTTLLQAIDFMAHVASGDPLSNVETWLKERDWTRSDLTSKFLRKQLIHFRLQFDFGQIVTWEGAYNITLGRCTREEIRVVGEEHPQWEVADGVISFGSDEDSAVDLSRFDYKGSVFSILRLPVNPVYLPSRIKELMANIKSLELLAPHRMRLKARNADDLGAGGEKLAGYLHGLSASQKQEVLKDLQQFYSGISGFNTVAKRAGWAQLHATEEYHSELGKLPFRLVTEAKHLNDGLLRILTIIAQTKTDHQFLLFDEIENGINPERIGQLMDYLLKAKQQIVVTTHNPLILNYLPDERAKESVFLLYRNRYGSTKAVRFFEQPEVVEKLEILGPGEAFLDTSLEDLVQCIEAREVVQA